MAKTKSVKTSDAEMKKSTAKAEEKKENKKSAKSQNTSKNTKSVDSTEKRTRKKNGGVTEIKDAMTAKQDTKLKMNKKTRTRVSKKSKAAAITEQLNNLESAAVSPESSLQALDIEARRMRLKRLIVLGKERGYLTYAEINDHLPDDMLDAEQIEGIISMINDMGISVHDEAPDAETLLMSDAATTVADEDVA
jgi:RNA polymerase primary sigma factor